MPIFGQIKPQALRLIQHPNQGDIGQGSGCRVIADHAANIAMRAAKPHLLHMGRACLGAVPEHRFKHRARLVDRQRLKAVANAVAQVMAVKGMFAQGAKAKQR